MHRIVTITRLFEGRVVVKTGSPPFKREVAADIVAQTVFEKPQLRSWNLNFEARQVILNHLSLSNRLASVTKQG